jgi:hypothetical protein
MIPRSATETLTIDLGEIGERDVIFTCVYTEGSRESGMSGPPENYDPGCKSEVTIMTSIIEGTDWDITHKFLDRDDIVNRLIEKFDETDWIE